MQKKLLQSLPLLKDQYIQFLAYTSDQESIDNIRDKFEFLEIKIGTKDLIVVIFEIDDYRELSKKNNQMTIELYRFSIMNIIKEAMLKKKTCDIFRFNNDKIIMVYDADNRINQEENQVEACKLVDLIREYIEKYIGITVTAVVGDYCVSIRAFNLICTRINDALRHKLSHGNNCVITASDIVRKEEDSITLSKKSEEELLTAIRIGNQQEAIQLFEEHMLFIYKSYEHIPDAFKKSVLDLTVAVLRLNVEFENQVFDLRQELDYIYNLEKLKTYEEIKNWARECVVRVSEERAKERMSRIEKDIEKAKIFIKTHLNENISLKKVSKHIALSQNYFSAMFKEIVGISFIDYLIDCRIEHAKTLLERDDMKVYEIANAVGYSDRRYFSDMFKKHVGMTPAEYSTKNRQ